MRATDRFGPVTRPQGISIEQQREVVEGVRKDILKCYIRAAKSAIVDYALLDARCRERLDMPFVPSQMPQWGTSPFTIPDIGTCGGPPQEWREGLQAARTALLARHVQNSSTALKLRRFWLEKGAEVRLRAGGGGGVSLRLHGCDCAQGGRLC